MQAYAESNIGLVRKENQDVYRLVQVDKRTALVLVCDGMGGAAGGKIAAETAADAFVAKFTASYTETTGDELPTPFQMQRVFSHAVYHANNAVLERAVAEPEYTGMGTTVVAACMVGGTLYVANVGDSRAYLIRNKTAKQLSHDDTLIQQLFEEGQLTEEEAKASAHKNLLTRVLGPRPYVEFTFAHEPLRKGDRVLLCSDGLYNYHEDSHLAALAHPDVDLRTVVKMMIHEACRTGGHDNITCVLVGV